MHSRPQNSVSNFFLRIFWSDGVADVDLQLSPPSLFFLLKGWSLFSIHMYMCFEFLCSVIYALWSSKSRNCWFTDGLCVKFNISCDYTHQQIWFELHTAMTAKKTYLDNRFRLRRSSDPLKGDSKSNWKSLRLYKLTFQLSPIMILGSTSCFLQNCLSSSYSLCIQGAPFVLQMLLRRRRRRKKSRLKLCLPRSGGFLRWRF